MAKVPKNKTVYRGAKVYKEGQECPFLKDSPAKEEPKKENHFDKKVKK